MTFSPNSRRRLLCGFLVAVALGIVLGMAQAKASDSGCGSDEECMALIYTPSFCSMVERDSYWWHLAGCGARLMSFELESVTIQPDGSSVTELVRDDSDGMSTRVTITLPPRHRQ
jgi:hypothetical protein